jgi:type IV pilus assembly protein PilE
LPTALQSVPSGTYAITASAAACPGVTPIPADGAAAFCLVATRQAAQTGDRCGDYTLTNAGTRGLANAAGSQAECWSR